MSARRMTLFGSTPGRQPMRVERLRPASRPAGRLHASFTGWPAEFVSIAGTMRPERATRLLGCALIGVLAGTGTAGALAARSRDEGRAAGASSVYISGRYRPGRLPIRPHGYYHHLSVHNLAWSSWGGPTAVAKGTFTFQFCIHENCAVSPYYDEPVTVTVGTIKRCRGRQSYTTLALDVEGPTPDSSFMGYRTSVGCRR